MAIEFWYRDDKYYADTTAEIAIDAELVKQKYEKVTPLDAAAVTYISNGADWIKTSDGSIITYYILTLTIGANTTLSVVDGDGRVLSNGDRIAPSTELTITAAADEGYDLTTYTVAGVDKTADNPTTYTPNASFTVVTAATEQV